MLQDQDNILFNFNFSPTSETKMFLFLASAPRVRFSVQNDETVTILALCASWDIRVHYSLR